MKIAHAGHAELLVHNLEASKQFFTETRGHPDNLFIQLKAALSTADQIVIA